jgi:epoxide hydrolase-like predicted phosphatase
MDPYPTTVAATTIDAVIFDYGGVFTPSPFTAAHAYAAGQGADPDTLIGIVFGSYGTDSDHPWHRLERGELSFPEALGEIGTDAEAAGLTFDAREMFRTMVQDEVDRTIVVDCVRRLRERGIATAILTNNIREYGDTWRASLGVDELFDTVVDSCIEGIRKPNPAIYELVLVRLGIDDPARAVFLDDFGGNVAAAQAVGLHGIVVGPDPRPAIETLEALVGVGRPERR